MNEEGSSACVSFIAVVLMISTVLRNVALVAAKCGKSKLA